MYSYSAFRGSYTKNGIKKKYHLSLLLKMGIMFVKLVLVFWADKVIYIVLKMTHLTQSIINSQLTST